MDNGALNIRHSLASSPDPLLTFNAALKERGHPLSMVIGNHALKAMEQGQVNFRHQQLVHPQVRGLLQDSDLQSNIWRQALESTFKLKPSNANYQESDLVEKIKESSLSLTLQPLCPSAVQQRYAEVVFEDF